MTLPRQVIPGRFYLITRRTTQQQFLLYPEKNVNEAFEYCLGVAAAKYDIAVLGTSVQSNHHHTVIYDKYGNYPAFLEYFHRLIARALNAYRGRKENFWSSDQVNVVRLEDIDSILDKLAYTFVNPVKHRLVARIEDWPGVNTYRALVDDRPIVVMRPKFFFRTKGTNMDATVMLRMTVPEVLGSRDAFVAALVERVAAKLEELRTQRRERNLGILGLHRLRQQTWRQRPRTEQRLTKENRNRRKPTVAVRGHLRQLEIAQRNQDFLSAYATARSDWLDGKKRCNFPVGSYWLGRFTRAPVPEPPPPPTTFPDPSTRNDAFDD